VLGGDCEELMFHCDCKISYNVYLGRMRIKYYSSD